MTPPLLTIGILSWNRLHYLRATLESARRCIQYPNIQWIVLDNVSTERGLADYLKSCDWLDELLFLPSDHVTAMNTILQHACGEALLLWPEDMQFVVAGDWMLDFMETLLANPWIGSMNLNFMRRVTLHSLFQSPAWQNARPMLGELKHFGGQFRIPRRLTSSRGAQFYSLGWKAPGIVGSGIPSLTRTQVWRELGGWKAPGATSLNDSSGGGETDMLERWRTSGQALQQVGPFLPVAADILTDPLGTKAKVRKNIRYGVYAPPPEGTFYYEIAPQAEAQKQSSGKLPLAFEDFVRPIGFDLPLNAQGGLLKAGIHLEIAEKIE